MAVWRQFKLISPEGKGGRERRAAGHQRHHRDSIDNACAGGCGRGDAIQVPTHRLGDPDVRGATGRIFSSTVVRF